MIRIFQRHCQFSANSANKQRPEWFDREKIFNNLMLTIFDDKYIDKVKYTAFYDTTNGKDHFIFNSQKTDKLQSNLTESHNPFNSQIF